MFELLKNREETVFLLIEMWEKLLLQLYVLLLLGALPTCGVLQYSPGTENLNGRRVTMRLLSPTIKGLRLHFDVLPRLLEDISWRHHQTKARDQNGRKVFFKIA
jgi:hypothetical protein